MLVCIGALALALAFGYTKYKAAKAQNALSNPQADQESVTEALTGHAGEARIAAHMPPQLSNANTAGSRHRETLEKLDATPRANVGTMDGSMRDMEQRQPPERQSNP